MPLRLGTRGSALAQWQAEWVAAQLNSLGVEVELLPITTRGDQRQEPLGAIGGEGLFTKEIQRALLDDRIDLAVHSLKDLPTAQPAELCLAAVPERAPAGDALVCLKHPSLDALPEDATVGTGSMRRRAQLLHVRRDLRMKDIRGNVETRLRKLQQGEYDALILAQAGLQRLGLAEKITQRLPLTLLLPAVGQGALALETRADDKAARNSVAPLNHPATHAAVVAERAMLAALQGGCLAPVAGYGRVENDRLILTGRVISHDGARLLEATLAADVANAAALGRQIAEALLAQGAAELICAARAV